MRWRAVGGLACALASGPVLSAAFAAALLGPRAQVAAQSMALPERSLALLELRFTPVSNAQVAIWLEKVDGTFATTVRLTEAVARRGIGNRPGASQMNSGFRWPYGRREGVLPVWAKRRAEAPGARQWKRIIFQNRASEGLASRTSNDFSRDDYYCLSFNRERSTKDALDAVSCASVFNSDKGRFITETDVAGGYGEPYEPTAKLGETRALSLHSLYPPRRDVERCPGTCNDHADVAELASHALDVMPEIDAVTMATPVGGAPQRILYEVPAHFAPGDYRACVEINVEGDYNDVWNGITEPTPVTPERLWDSWATGYGYPYRGQPSVVYCADVALGGSEATTVQVEEPAGSAGAWRYDDAAYGTLMPMDGMTDDPVGAPGSGADRLELTGEGHRLEVFVKPSLSCMEDAPPGGVAALETGRHSDERNAHQWATLRFEAADDDHGVFRYDVRVSTEPIDDEASFMAAMPAKEATLEAAELRVPTDAPAGDAIEVEMGGLVAETHYFVAVRPMDDCAGVGPLAVTEMTTPKRVFATVTPCFVATAAYGSPLAAEIGALRELRDRYLMSHALGRAVVDGYYAVGPTLADAIREHEGLRAAARAVLAPLVALARLTLAEP
jgi:hypothetical protein